MTYRGEPQGANQIWDGEKFSNVYLFDWRVDEVERNPSWFRQAYTLGKILIG